MHNNKRTQLRLCPFLSAVQMHEYACRAQNRAKKYPHEQSHADIFIISEL